MPNLLHSPTLRAARAQAIYLLRGRTTGARIIRGTGGTFVLRLLNMALKFASSLALARLLGPEEYGIFNFAQAWLLVLIVPAVAGFDRLLVRDLSIYLTQEAWAAMRGAIRFATRGALALSCAVAALSLLAAWLTYRLTGRPALLNADQAEVARAALVTLGVALLVLPLRAILLVQQGAMRGLRQVVLSQVPDLVIQPGLFLLAVSVAYVGGRALQTANLAMLLFAGSTGAALVAGAWALNRTTPPPLREAQPVFLPRLWLASAVPFALSQVLGTLNTQVDALMLGALDSPTAVAYYTVTQRLTMVITLPLLSVTVALAPHVASLHAAGRLGELQRAITSSTRLVVALSLPFTALFVVAGTFFLGLFGEEYRVAQTALAIFSLGQLVNTVTGPVIILLMMTGHERAATATTGAGVALHVLLNALLIPRWSIEGAAIAGGISVAALNLAQAALAWRWLRINSLPLGPTVYR